MTREQEIGHFPAYTILVYSPQTLTAINTDCEERPQVKATEKKRKKERNFKAYVVSFLSSHVLNRLG